MATPSARRAAAWAVHFYTALGAVFGVFALLEAAAHDARAAFLWLAAALAVDASDGALARWIRVKEVVPEYDGAELDDIIDYLNFVVVPVFLMLRLGLLAGPAGHLAGAAAVLASAYRFCHADAKTPDHFFTGFPSYWNVVAFYLYVFEVPPAVGALLTGVLALFVFSRLRFVYPSRTTFLRPLTLALGLVWGASSLVVLAALPEREKTLAAFSLFYPAYYTAVSFYLQLRPKSATAAG